MADYQLGENSRLINQKWFTTTPQGQALGGSRCPTCGRVYFPKKRVCPSCFQRDQMEEIPLSRRGRLYTYTVVEAGPPGFTVPYAIGYVDLPEGVRVFSPLEVAADELEIGMELELALGPLRQEEGVVIIGYAFRPAAGGAQET